MAKLINTTQNSVVVERVKVAQSLFSRMKGLIGETKIGKDETLWIKRCNSIHTCFMRFPIDAVFVDKSLKVKSINTRIKPWMVVLPIWGASSVFELAAGTVERTHLKVGDQLNVDD